MRQMEADLQLVLIGVVDQKEASRLRGHLDDQGVEVFLRTDPADCSSGSCSTKIEIHVMERDIEKVREFLQQERAKSFEGLEINPQWLEHVYDTSQESANCPACGTNFSTQLKECPDCGLVFHVEEV
jgi:hypothetical protein